MKQIQDGADSFCEAKHADTFNADKQVSSKIILLFTYQLVVIVTSWFYLPLDLFRILIYNKTRKKTLENEGKIVVRCKII